MSAPRVYPQATAQEVLALLPDVIRHLSWGSASTYWDQPGHPVDVGAFLVTVVEVACATLAADRAQAEPLDVRPAEYDEPA